MPIQHKILSAQVIVITGATTSIGTATARLAAKHGARLVLADDDSVALDQLAGDVRRAGGEVLAMRVDAAVKEQVTALGRAAVQRFGRIDTWVNHGARDVDVALTQAARERRFKTGFWATVHGTIAARGLMREEGGAIVNLDSDASAKHDVKGFTDALREEIDTDGVPISVTLVHALGAATKATPRLMAEAILYAAGHAKPVIRVGRPRSGAAAQGLLSRCLDLFMLHTPHKNWRV